MNEIIEVKTLLAEPPRKRIFCDNWIGWAKVGAGEDVNYIMTRYYSDNKKYFVSIEEKSSLSEDVMSLEEYADHLPYYTNRSQLEKLVDRAAKFAGVADELYSVRTRAPQFAGQAGIYNCYISQWKPDQSESRLTVPTMLRVIIQKAAPSPDEDALRIVKQWHHVTL